MARWQGNAIEQPPPGEDPEEQALARLQGAKAGTKIQEIDLSLRRARLRRAAYADQGAERDVEIQDAVIDRLLRDRFQVTRSGVVT